jgi:hypothetical protein
MEEIGYCFTIACHRCDSIAPMENSSTLCRTDEQVIDNNDHTTMVHQCCAYAYHSCIHFQRSKSDNCTASHSCGMQFPSATIHVRSRELTTTWFDGTCFLPRVTEYQPPHLLCMLVHASRPWSYASILPRAMWV